MNETKNSVTVDEVFEKIAEYLTPEQVALVRKAYELAAKAHEGQFRKSGDPYIIHPLNVVGILTKLHLDEKCLAAGFLHDVVEDTEYTLENITEMFDEEVAHLVDGVTKLGKIEYTSTEERQVENYHKMFLAMAKDIRVVLIKLADRLHNMRTLSALPPERDTAPWSVLFALAMETLCSDFLSPLVSFLVSSSFLSSMPAGSVE